LTVAACFAAWVTALCLGPPEWAAPFQRPLKPLTGHNDVSFAGHLVVFGGLGLVGGLAWGLGRRAQPWGPGLCLLLLIAAGAALEWLQALRPGRGVDGEDLVANVAGVALGWGALILIGRRRRRGVPPEARAVTEAQAATEAHAVTEAHLSPDSAPETLTK
jgi:hypothetical protein